MTRKERKEAKRALEFRTNFRAAIKEAADKASRTGDPLAVESLAAWGTENDGNNVSVGEKVAGSTASVRLLPDSDQIEAKFIRGLSGAKLAVVVAHEGRHVADANTWLTTHCTGCATDMNHYTREDRAWQISGVMAEALGMKNYAPKGGGKEYRVWDRGWKTADVQTLRSKGIANILKKLYNVQPTDTNTYSAEHTHRP